MNTKLMSPKTKKNRFLQDSCALSVIVLMSLSSTSTFSIPLILAILILTTLMAFKTIEIVNNYLLKRMFVSHFHKNGLKFEENKVYDLQDLVDQGMTIINEEISPNMPRKFALIIMDNRGYPLLFISFVLLVMSLFLPHHNLITISALSLLIYMLFS